jgi:hypothetical protein
MKVRMAVGRCCCDGVPPHTCYACSEITSVSVAIPAFTTSPTTTPSWPSDVSGLSHSLSDISTAGSVDTCEWRKQFALRNPPDPNGLYPEIRFRLTCLAPNVKLDCWVSANFPRLSSANPSINHLFFTGTVALLGLFTGSHNLLYGGAFSFPYSTSSLAGANVVATITGSS